MHDVRDRGIRSVVEEALTVVGRRPGVSECRRRRARPGVRARDRHAGAGWHDIGRPAVGLPRDLLTRRAGRDGRRRGRADRGRQRGRHRARRRPDRARGDYGAGTAPGTPSWTTSNDASVKASRPDRRGSSRHGPEVGAPAARGVTVAADVAAVRAVEELACAGCRAARPRRGDERRREVRGDRRPDELGADGRAAPGRRSPP